MSGWTTVLIGLLTSVLAVHCAKTAITLSPQDTTVPKGERVQLKCESDSEYVAWMFLDDNGDFQRLFTSNDPDNYDKEKYQIDMDRTQPIMKYYLTFLSPEWRDGGKYQCMDLDSLNQGAANLVVLEPPTITVPLMQEGGTYNITCEAIYGGPELNHFKESHIPKLASYMSGNSMSSKSTRVDGSPGINYSIVKQGFSYHATSQDSGETLTCAVSTLEPAYEMASDQMIDVEFAVRDISIVPALTEIEVGGYFNCTAKGSPAVRYVWWPIKSPGPFEVEASKLDILANMVGDNEWKCIATNTAQGSEPLTQTITFVVLPPTLPEADPSTDQGPETWVIATATVVPLLVILVIVVVIVLLVIKKKRNSPSKKEDDVPAIVVYSVPMEPNEDKSQQNKDDIPAKYDPASEPLTKDTDQPNGNHPIYAQPMKPKPMARRPPEQGTQDEKQSLRKSNEDLTNEKPMPVPRPRVQVLPPIGQAGSPAAGSHTVV